MNKTAASGDAASAGQPCPLLIVNLNDTLAGLARRRGVLAEWIAHGLGLPDSRLRVVDPRGGAELPAHEGLAGVVVSGSVAMVTDCRDWSQRVAAWLAQVVAANVPVLGICYGHQILAHAIGGCVSYNPNGQEYGTVEIRLLPAAKDDPLLSHLPAVFHAQAIHSQSVIRLPDGAVRLAENDHDRHQAFRVGKCAWGVQFHPEFDVDIVRSLARARDAGLRAEGLDPDAISAAARETPQAASVLARFAKFVDGSGTDAVLRPSVSVSTPRPA